MFLRPTVLNRLMKRAYKTGLTVARTEDDWIYLGGRYWEASIKRGFIPKKTMGDIITLVGELPGRGERFTATKDGNQMETGMPLTVRDGEVGPDTLIVTDMILIGTGGTPQRLLQDEDTGDIYAVNNVFIDLVSSSVMDEDKGEYGLQGPLFHPAYGVLWENNVCRLRACFRADEKNDKVLKNLKGVDITPEIPQQ